MTMNLRRRVLVAAGLAALAGCLYLEDTFPSLEPGDVTGVLVGVKPGKTGVEGLKGGSVWIHGSSVRRTSDGDGRFTLRNLPQGDHVVMMSWDANADRFPDLVKVLGVPIRIPSGKTDRPRVDVGRVELLPPSTITGRLVAAGGAACVNVATMDVYIDGTEVRARAGADGRFRLAGLGAHTWTVAAVGGGAGVKQEVTVGPDEVKDMGDLVVECATGSGTFRLELFGPDASTAGDGGFTFQQPLLPAPSATACNPQGACWDRRPGAGGFLFDNMPFDAYALDVDLGDQFQVTHFLFVVVSDAEPQLVRLMISMAPSDKYDLDGDGAEEMPEPSDLCGEPCRTALLQDPLATCNAYDCDDDGDGQSDLDERGAAGAAGCRCGITAAGVDGGPPCTRDPFRSDVDNNGICDIFERPAQGTSSGGGESWKDQVLLGTGYDATMFNLVGVNTTFSRAMNSFIYFRVESVADVASRSGRLRIMDSSTGTQAYTQDYTFGQTYGHIWLNRFASPATGSYEVRAFYVSAAGAETFIASSPLTMTQ